MGPSTLGRLAGRQLFQLGRLGDSAAALEGIVERWSTTCRSASSMRRWSSARAARSRGDDGRVRTCCKIANNLLRTGTPGVATSVWLLSLAAMAAGDPSGAHAHLGVLRRSGGSSVAPELPLDVTDAIALVRIARAVGDDALAHAAVASTQELVTLNPSVDSIAGTAAQDRGLTRLMSLRSSPKASSTSVGALAASRSRPRWKTTATPPRLMTKTPGLQSSARHSSSIRSSALHGTPAAYYRLRSLGVRRRVGTTTPARSGWEALTTSERDVVRLVALGLRNREVGERS